MENKHHFNFKSNISEIRIPNNLNNPFDSHIPKIAQIAAKEFQDYITSESQNWPYNFSSQKGKMFGILVFERPDNSYHYLGTVSGKTPGNAVCHKFIPSIFDDSVDDFFINKGMSQLTEISQQIEQTNNQTEIDNLIKQRRQKSLDLQQQLFENYRFINVLGKEKNVIEIFSRSLQGKPPSAAGECAAPKLLQYAFKHRLKPIAIAEFWWGNALINREKVHGAFHPACKNKCRPILEFMLNNNQLFNHANNIID